VSENFHIFINSVYVSCISKIVKTLVWNFDTETWQHGVVSSFAVPIIRFVAGCNR
jgi:hypothetical protein